MLSSKQKRLLQEWLPGYLFLVPALIFFTLFVLYPMLKGIYYSFCDYTQTNFIFTGLKNYILLLKDRNFIKSMTNTILIVLINVPLVVIIALLVSLAVYKRSEKTRSFFRAAYYLPSVASIVTISLIWQWVYNPIYGILNYIVGLFGLPWVNWLGDPGTALASVILILLTLSVGESIILYIAALGNIPSVYIEVADIDGANNWNRFKHIYWPLLLPTSLYVIVITTISSFQTFAIIQLLTGGGPYYSTSTIMFQLYQMAFEFQKYGMASAMGIILSLIIVVISIIQYKYLSTDVEY